MSVSTETRLGSADSIRITEVFQLEEGNRIATRLLRAAKEGRLASGAFRHIRETVREYFYRLMLRQPYARSPMVPCVSLHGDFTVSPVCVLVKQSLDRALASIDGPPDFVREIEGMSGQKYRTFINCLVGHHPDARYLEIGSWRGSTATAALCGNSVKALCIDNWSQFGGSRLSFLENIERVLSPSIDFRFVEDDFRRVDYSALGRFNIFLFDGPHEEKDQYDGVTVARPALDKSFILIVDDWNWRKVRLGTFRAIRDSHYLILASVEIRTTLDNSHARAAGRQSDWRNGYFIAVLVAN